MFSKTKIKNLIMSKTKNNGIILATLCIIIFLDFLGYGIILPIIAPILFNSESVFFDQSVTNKVRSFFYGAIVAIYPISQFFGSFIIGNLADKWGRKKVLTITLTSATLGHLFFLLGLTLSEVSMLIVSRFITGLAGSNVALANTIISDISEKSNKGRNYGFITLSMALGIIIGPLIGGQLTTININYPPIITPYSLPLYVSILLSILTLLSVTMFLKETYTTQQGYRSNNFTELLDYTITEFKGLFKSNLKHIFLVSFLTFTTFNMFVHFMNLYFSSHLNFSPKQIGDYLSYAAFCFALSMGIINPYLSRKFSANRILLFSLIGVGISILLVLLANHVKHIYIITFFYTLFFSISYTNISTLISDFSAQDDTGKYFGINHSLNSLAELLSSVLVTFLFAINIKLPIITSAILVFTAWYTLLQQTPKNRENSNNKIEI